MATVIKYKINGVETQPYREAINLEVSAVFGVEAQPSISLDSIVLVDTDKAKNSTLVRDLFAANPIEGPPFSITITDGLNIYEFDFYLDFTNMRYLSDVETEIGLVKRSSIEQFELRAQAITQTLLNSEGLLLSGDYSPVPYVVENRKTLIERLQILNQTFNTIKSIFDEIHKLLNLASDIPTLGAAAAAANAAATIAAISALAVQLFDLLQQIQESFFPPVRYHSGLKPKTFVEKAAVNYMGYDAVDWGTLTPIIDLETWCGSKNDEKGVPQYILVTAPNPTILQIQSGLFKPSDPGYVLFDTIQILKDKYRLRLAIINNVLHIRPENDPFWVSQSAYTLPDLKIEQIFAQNGTIRPNYDDVKASTTVQYTVDDSDLWTLEDLADEADENSTGKIIAVRTLEPQSVTDNRNILLRGAEFVNIPHCLASRKDQIDDLLDLFLGSADQFSAFKDQIESILNQWGQVIGAGNPKIEEFVTSLGNRTGAMKIEHDYFSIPKQMLIEINQQGLPTIPSDFVDKIGAKALLNNFHSWDSFIPGNRNPLEPSQTAAKDVYEDVRIPFGLKDFVTILNNAYFVTNTGQVGKFTKLDWNVEGDFAVASWWIYNDWMSNITEVIS